MEDGIFSVENRYIGRLGPLDAVNFFHDLLQVEAARIGISCEIHTSERLAAPDGGIDASSHNRYPIESELIRSGYSGFQIKTGTAFRPTDASFKKQLFGERRQIQKDNLGSSVVRCLDAGGHLTFVCFGLDPTESERNSAITKIKEWLTVCGYSDASVRIWGQSNIKGFLHNFPSLCLKINGRDGIGLRILESWRASGDMLPEVLSIGEAQKSIINEIRERLLTSTEAVHLRITGESGVGKTRLLLEALDHDALRPLVLYTDKPEHLESQGFLSDINLPDNKMEVVLVLDDCPLDIARDFWNRIQRTGRRIRLVSVYNEIEERSSDTVSITVPPLANKEVANILRQYVPEEYIDRWARFCEGSPRFANVIGANLKSGSLDVLAEPDNITVMHRYIAGIDDPTSQMVKDRALVLRFLALFPRVGYKDTVANEANAVYGLISTYARSIDRARFDEIIHDLHERRILQGEKTYYITPNPLHVKLWIEWWERHADSLPFDAFAALPPSLSSGFEQMFRYAHMSPAAMRTVVRLLGTQGPFADGNLMKQDAGGDFFLTLVEADPEKALERLEATTRGWSREELLMFKKGRQQMIWSLEKIAVWKGLFTRAMHVLLRLAEAENDTTFSNNATGVFKDSFSVFSGTEESPMQRLAFIEELLASGDPKKESIAIKAMAVALENGHTRVIGAEYQGLRREPRLWSPWEHPEESNEYRHKVWDMLTNLPGVAAAENNELIIQTLIHQLHILGRTPEMSVQALDTARRLSMNEGMDKNALIETVVQILHYGVDELPEDMRKLWRDFYAELVPDDLTSLLNRHVAMRLVEDNFREDGGYTEEDKTKRIEELAARSLKNREEFFKNLSWIVTKKASNGHLFGYHLGKQDKEMSLLPIILEARMNAPSGNQPNQYFLGGYFRAVYEDDSSTWEKLFFQFSTDDRFLPFLPELAWRAGHTDVMIEHLLTLIEENKVDPASLDHFRYGVSVREFGEPTLRKFVRLLLSRKEKFASSIALDVFARYCTEKDSGHDIMKDIALEILTDFSFFNESDRSGNVMDRYLWAKVAEQFLDMFGSDKEATLRIGRLMLHSMGNQGSILDQIDKHIRKVLLRISEMYPNEMWTEALDNMEERGYFIFKRWLSASMFLREAEQPATSVLQKIKLSALWEWIDADVEKRAWFVANLVPKDFTSEHGEPYLAREMLMRYGQREDVRSNLMANFFSEGWTGRASEHHKRKLDEIIPFREKETDPNVIRWLNEYIERRRQSIEDARTEEERSDFWR